jgi:small-conductance mechanosensitive channel
MTDPAPVKPTGATAASSATTGSTAAQARTGGQDAAVRATLGVAAPTEPERTIGQLVASASRDVSTLVRNEIALAKSELKVSVRAGGLSIALFAAAGFIAVLAIIMLSVALAYFISMTGLHLAWSFSIVFLFYLLVAAILGFVGYKKLRGVKAPERAIHQAQETKNALMHR